MDLLFGHSVGNGVDDSAPVGHFQDIEIHFKIHRNPVQIHPDLPKSTQTGPSTRIFQIMSGWPQVVAIQNLAKTQKDFELI